MSFMLNEIHEQPDVITGLVGKERNAAVELAAEIERRDICYVVIAARGTSHHAATYGKYLLEIRNGLPVALAAPSVYTLHSAQVMLSRAMVIGISQSGQATDVAECLEQAKSMGALTLAITNVPGSLLTTIAEYTIHCHAGDEKAVAATKTYTSTLAALYLLSSALAHDMQVDNILACADMMRKALSLEERIASKAERYRYMQSGYVISRGFNYCTALETALKLAETCYVGMLAYSAADVVHGPIAAVQEGEPCLLYAAPGVAHATMVDMARRLRQRNAETVIFSSEEGILSHATTPFKLDVSIPEELSPLVYVVPGQLLAYYLAVARGVDPDCPRGLSKVTLTR